MKIMELLTVNRFNQAEQPILRTTPRHYEMSRGDKMQVIVLMYPLDFLKLAAPVGEIDYFKSATQGVRAYNGYAKSDETIHLPWLTIRVSDLELGKVTRHEGRHRAAAVLNAGGKWLRVGLDLDGTADYVPEMAKAEIAQLGRTKNNMEYYMTAKDLPAMIAGQYSDIRMPTRDWKIEEPDNLGRYRR